MSFVSGCLCVSVCAFDRTKRFHINVSIYVKSIRNLQRLNLDRLSGRDMIQKIQNTRNIPDRHLHRRNHLRHPNTMGWSIGF